MPSGGTIRSVGTANGLILRGLSREHVQAGKPVKALSGSNRGQVWIGWAGKLLRRAFGCAVFAEKSRRRGDCGALPFGVEFHDHRTVGAAGLRHGSSDHGFWMSGLRGLGTFGFRRLRSSEISVSLVPRRQVHWTRSPSNVSQRTRLTPRNLRNRSFRRPRPPGSRSPTTSIAPVRRRGPKTWSEDVVRRRGPKTGA